LVLDNELEDTRIRLSTERDFYPKVCFRSFIATSESREQLRKNLAEGKDSDGLTELEADSESIYGFIKKNSASDIGMCTQADLENFLAEFNKQRLASILPCSH